MTLKILLGVTCVLAILALTAVLRALPRRKKTRPSAGQPVDIPSMDEAIPRFQALVRQPTISIGDLSLMDWDVFNGFKQLLLDLYPTVAAKGNRVDMGPTGVLYRIAGKSSAQPVVLMSHYDVVSVADSWSRDPFGGELIDGEIWGRGTVDTKITLWSILEATEKLLREGFLPENDIYLSFSGDEESSGRSCNATVDWMEKEGIHPAMVLDEGSYVYNDNILGVKEPLAMVAVAEKGALGVEVKVCTKGGHSSLPPLPNSLALVGKAVAKMDGSPLPIHMTGLVRTLVDAVADQTSSFRVRLLLRNRWLFMPLIRALCRRNKYYNAFTTTTLAFTMASGSKKGNVLPSTAEISGNFRTLPGDTQESLQKKYSKLVQDKRVAVTVGGGPEPSPVSSTNTPHYQKLCAAVEGVWQVPATPCCFIAGTDAKFFGRICPDIYRFSPLEITLPEAEYAHSDDERIRVGTAKKCLEFYSRLIRTL